MATSRSTEGCTGSAAIYSGRRDPEWEVPVETAQGLRELWNSLEPARCAAPAAPALGYRGCTLTCQAHDRWFAYGGVVSFENDHRRDPERSFERMLLRSASKELLPAWVIEQVK